MRFTSAVSPRVTEALVPPIDQRGYKNEVIEGPPMVRSQGRKLHVPTPTYCYTSIFLNYKDEELKFVLLISLAYSNKDHSWLNSKYRVARSPYNPIPVSNI